MDEWMNRTHNHLELLKNGLKYWICIKWMYFIKKHITRLRILFLHIPGTNAAIERVLSIINVLWTDKNNHFLAEV
jgi:hypothetical protein